jgi:DNA invertase Pin-like site-specific DNA recombinase
MSAFTKHPTEAPVVDGYCRVSTDPQEDNTSLDEQEACIRQYCKEHGLTLGMMHREVWSGYQYREREKLGLMRERYRDGKIQGVVTRTLDRLSRSQVHNAILMEEMEHHKVTLHCVKEKKEWRSPGRSQAALRLQMARRAIERLPNNRRRPG